MRSVEICAVPLTRGTSGLKARGCGRDCVPGTSTLGIPPANCSGHPTRLPLAKPKKYQRKQECTDRGGAH